MNAPKRMYLYTVRAMPIRRDMGHGVWDYYIHTHRRGAFALLLVSTNRAMREAFMQ